MPALVHEHLRSDFNIFRPEPHLPPSPTLADAVAYALQKCPGFKFLPSNCDAVDDSFPRNGSPASAHFSCDAFRMYEFKVRRCMRGRSHDWTECPFAHPGEKARRRDPRRIHYSGSPCPEFRKGSCRRGDACEFAHGVFECWLHPARYRTQECKDGKNCKRRVCFFAHSQEQLRVLPVSPASAASPEAAFGHGTGSSTETVSVNKLISDATSAPSSVDTMKYSPSRATQSLPSMAHSPFHASPLAIHQAAMQNMQACKGYGVNLNAAEYTPLLDSYEGIVNAQMACSPHPGLQQVHFMNDFNEAFSAKFNLPVGKSSHDLPIHSHEFTSPTSTLAGLIFSPPPLSPPLSPLTSPNSIELRQSRTNSANDCHNYFVDGKAICRNICDATCICDNQSYVEDLNSRLQNLHVAYRGEASYAVNNQCGSVRTAQPVISQQTRLPFFKNSSLTLSHPSRKAVWGHANEFACPESGEFEPWQTGNASAQFAGVSKLGEESTGADNFAPDFGWVSELVK